MLIKPSSELRNSYPEISKLIKQTNEPVFITKNGHGDTVVLSIESYREMKQQNETYGVLYDAVHDYISTPKKNLVDSDVVFENMKNIIKEKAVNV